MGAHPQCVSRPTACEPPAFRNPRQISVFCDGSLSCDLSWRAVTLGGKYDATQFVRKAVKQYAAETGCRTRRRIHQEPDRGRTGSARDVCRCDRDRQLSRSSKPVAVQQPVQPVAPVSAPAPAVPTPAAVPTPVVAKAKKRRAATLSYVNREYGLSFNFPRNYQLKTSATAASTSETEVKRRLPLQRPSLADEFCPSRRSRTGSAWRCPAIRIPERTSSRALSSSAWILARRGSMRSVCVSCDVHREHDAPTPAKIEQVKFGATEFHEFENNGGAVSKQADAKYYHAFNNGACYEFALGIATNDDSKVEEITPVDRQAVFARLEKILATVKLQPAAMPETQTPVPAVAATTPADSSSPSEHQTAAPNF